MTRAEMVAYLRFRLPGFEHDNSQGARNLDAIATELERLGAIADAAVALVDAQRERTNAFTGGDAFVMAIAEEMDELHRVVAERRGA